MAEFKYVDTRDKIAQELLSEQSQIIDRPQYEWNPQPAQIRQVTPTAPMGDFTPQRTYTPQIGEQTFTPIQPAEIDDEYEWWEKPKEVWTSVEEGLAKGISKAPVLPDVLEWASPAFDLMADIEQNWASAITAPFSPTLAYKQGESWLEHQKREYEAWNAPTYVKGVAENAMPLWWLPWFGWVGRGAKAIGVGTKGFEATAKALKNTKKLELPTREFLNKNLYADNWMRNTAQWTRNKPVLGKLVERIGGKAAFIKSGDDLLPIDKFERELMNREFLRGMGSDVQAYAISKLPSTNPLNVFGVGKDQYVGNFIRHKSGKKYGVRDVIENPDSFEFIGKQGAEAKKYANDVRKVLNEMDELAISEGVKIPKGTKLSLDVEGEIIDKKLVKARRRSSPEIKRTHEIQREGIENGVIYNNNVDDAVRKIAQHRINQIAEKRFTDATKEFGETSFDRLHRFEPDFVEEFGKVAEKYGATTFANQAVKRLKSYKGSTIPSATMSKIRRLLPQTAAKIDKMLSFKSSDFDKIFGSYSKELQKSLKLSKAEFKEHIAKFVDDKNSIKFSQVSDALDSLNIDKNLSAKMLERIYKNSYKFNKDEWKVALKELGSELDNSVKSLKAQIKPLNSKKKQLMEQYSRAGIGEAKFKSIPAFNNRIFPEEFVDIGEKLLGDQGQEWLEQSAKMSSLMRTSVAALDLSAPFIQGLPIIGRNPAVWAKMVKKNVEFFKNPEKVTEFLNSPAQKVARLERLKYGGSLSTFEFVEAMPQLRKIGTKVEGKLGAKAEGKVAKAIEQTYGRAEAAFIGSGEAARNYLWMALKKPNMADDQLRELARSIDRMTGTMNTKALGLGATQTQFEKAFMFFAQRYTRASLSLVGDMLRGGMAGSEARKALGSLMAGGLMAYHAFSNITGQPMYLDPRSAKFMTLKVGDSHVGVSGIMYSLLRMGADVIATAEEDPSAFLDILNRKDNPFAKFMYQKTSPLTGLGVGVAFEQENYFGEPFESPVDWAKFLSSKFIPISMQSLIEDEPDLRIFGAEFAGMRTYPESDWEKRDEVRNELAQKNYGQNYDELDELFQSRIDADESVVKLNESIEKTQRNRGDEKDIAFVDYKNEMERAFDQRINLMAQAEHAYEMGMMSGWDYKERIKDINYAYGRNIEYIKDNPAFKVVTDSFTDKTDDNLSDNDKAYYELVEKLYSGAFEQYGIYDYESANKFKESIRQKYGDKAYAYATQRMNEKQRYMPTLAREYYKGQEILAPYWNIQTEADKYFGTRDSSAKQSFINRNRKMLMRNPQIAYYYNLFYKRS